MLFSISESQIDVVHIQNKVEVIKFNTDRRKDEKADETVHENQSTELASNDEIN